MSTLVRIEYSGYVEGEIDADPNNPDAWAEAISELWQIIRPVPCWKQPKPEMVGHDLEEQGEMVSISDANERWADGYEAGLEAGQERDD